MIFSGIKLSNDRSHRGVSSHRKFDANGRPELKITVESQSSWETYCRAPSEPDRPTLLSTQWTQQQTQQYKLHINYLNTCHSDLTASINKETVKLTVNSPTESQFQAQWVNLTCSVKQPDDHQRSLHQQPQSAEMTDKKLQWSSWDWIQYMQRLYKVLKEQFNQNCWL